MILGHSERRTLFHETSALVANKTCAAISEGLSVILCVGETLAEREGGRTDAVVREQLQAVVDALKTTHPDDGGKAAWAKIVIAYEPVWAIGTGKVATSQQAQDTQAATRAYLREVLGADVADATRIIYGGSVNEKNCKELGQLCFRPVPFEKTQGLTVNLQQRSRMSTGSSLEVHR